MMRSRKTIFATICVGSVLFVVYEFSADAIGRPRTRTGIIPSSTHPEFHNLRFRPQMVFRKTGV